MNHPESTQEQFELAALLAMLTLSDGEVAQMLGVSPITIRSWRTGRRTPTAENRESLVASARAHAEGILKLALGLERRGADERASHSPEDELAGPGGCRAGMAAQEASSSSMSDPI